MKEIPWNEGSALRSRIMQGVFGGRITHTKGVPGIKK